MCNPTDAIASKNTFNVYLVDFEKILFHVLFDNYENVQLSLKADNVIMVGKISPK